MTCANPDQKRLTRIFGAAKTTETNARLAPDLIQEIAHQHLFNQFWLTVFFVIPMVLVARAVVGAIIARWIQPLIALPQIFFVMLLSAGLGSLIPRWAHGPSVRCLLFAGIPLVLAANFVIGGSRIGEAFNLTGMNPVLAYGFFGQIFWMFGGISLLILLGRSAGVHNVWPGMAGALSHAGLTGACTAGDLGDAAAKRAPIMINIPFFGRVFVFSVLAVSTERGTLWLLPSISIAIIGIGLTVFGGLLFLAIADMPVGNALMAISSSLSHFGLFAAIQGGMAGSEAAGMIAFVFAMPFLGHPLVFSCLAVPWRPAVTFHDFPSTRSPLSAWPVSSLDCSPRPPPTGS
jgi:hypothetical protein